MKKNYRSLKFFSSVLLILVILIPFLSDVQDSIYPAIEITDASVGYYQSNTCNISLLSVLKKNYNNLQNIEFRENNYAALNCLGKVTGLDKSSDLFVLSIGTNSNYTLFFQGILWCLIVLLFSQNFSTKNIKYKLILVLTTFFTLQHLSEERFYSRVNQYFSSNLNLENTYLFNIFMTYFIIFLLLSLFIENNEKSIINKFPYMFLMIGTFNGFNLNFYSLIFSYLGLKNFLTRKFITKFNLIYFTFSLLWIFTTKDSNSYFDTDKLKGFINSSNTTYSLIYWAILYFLIFHCFIYLYRVSDLDLKELSINFLISGSLLTIFGILGSVSKFQNFLNYMIFGQNKRGINTFESIAGNTWRGFSSSAESIAEFLGFGILFCILLVVNKKIDFDWKLFSLSIFPIYSLYRTNNIAVVLSLIFICSFVLIQNLPKNYLKILNNKFFILIASLSIFSISTYLIFSSFDYDYVSKLLIYEASLQSNFFSNMEVYGKWLYTTNYFENNDIYSLIFLENAGTPSSTLRFITQIFHQENFNIPFIPNLVVVLSFVSLLINRSGLWSIFIAKYNPNLLEAIVGNGPSQFNNYLYKLKLNLFAYKEVPDSLPTSLFLPHSSFLDIIVFFGILGFLIFTLWNFYVMYVETYENYFKMLLFFLLINFFKSDSILYINSFTLLMFTYVLILNNRDKYFYEN